MDLLLTNFNMGSYRDRLDFGASLKWPFKELLFLVLCCLGAHSFVRLLIDKAPLISGLKAKKSNKDRSRAAQPPGLRAEHLEQAGRTSREGTETTQSRGGLEPKMDDGVWWWTDKREGEKMEETRERKMTPFGIEEGMTVEAKWLRKISDWGKMAGRSEKVRWEGGRHWVSRSWD